MLTQKIVAIHERSRCAYGSPRVTEELEAEGFEVGRKRVARLMVEAGLSADLRPKFRNANSQPTSEAASNALARQFNVEAPDRVWVSDITYVWTVAGWLYLAVVIDLFSRRVVGWAMADHMRAVLVIEALGAALGSREPSREGLLFHSDQGSQYTATRVREALDHAGITCSMSRRGNCWDNAVAESFFSSLKKERIRKRIYKTRDLARADVFDYIEVFYNRTRRHSHLGGVSPEAFENASL